MSRENETTTLMSTTPTVFASGFTQKDNLMLGLTAIPFFAVNLFVIGTKPQSSEEITMAGLMLFGTGLPFLTEVAHRFREPRQAIATIHSVLLSAAMVFMMKNAIQNKDKNPITKDVYYSVMGFSLYVAINLVYNAFKLAKIITQDVPILEFISNAIGFVASTGFLRAQIMSYEDSLKLHDSAEKKKAIFVSGTAAGFMVVTSMHALFAAKKMDLGTRMVDSARSIHTGVSSTAQTIWKSMSRMGQNTQNVDRHVNSYQAV